MRCPAMARPRKSPGWSPISHGWSGGRETAIHDRHSSFELKRRVLWKHGSARGHDVSLGQFREVASSSNQPTQKYLKIESQYMGQVNQQQVLRIHPNPRRPVVPPAPIMAPAPVRAPAVAGLNRDDRLQVAVALVALRRFVEQQNAALTNAIDTLGTTVQNIMIRVSSE